MPHKVFDIAKNGAAGALALRSMVVNLSSSKIRSAASLVTSVPLMPMAMPMSAARRGWRVIDAITSHGPRFRHAAARRARCAACAFRRHPGVYADAWREPEQIFIGHGFQLLAFHYPGA